MPLVILFQGPWRWLGGALIVLGVIFIAVPAWQFGTRGTTIKPFQESSALVVDGLFSISRNPIYLGMVMITAGTWVGLGSASPLVVVIGFFFILTELFIKQEERMLERQFDSEYRQYKERVRRWV
jgi:protein-S-isoprenylcysteine O-methyltransferase Ste14